MEQIKPIKTEADFTRALGLLDSLWQRRPAPGSDDFARLELLGILIEDYERKAFPIAAPDPIEAIKFYMEQHDLSQSDFARLIRSRSRASEILNRKAGLSLTQIRTIAREWHLPAEILIQKVA